MGRPNEACEPRPAGTAVSRSAEAEGTPRSHHAAMAAPLHNDPVRVLVVDDHPALRAGMATIIEAQHGLAVDREARLLVRTMFDHAQGLVLSIRAGARGYNLKSAASAEGMVKTHVRAVLAKRGAIRRTEAVNLARERGLLK